MTETPDQRGPEEAGEATVAADPPTEEHAGAEPESAQESLGPAEPPHREGDTWSTAIIGAPAEPPPRVQGEFSVVFRGYDREAVDAHLAALEQEVTELHATRSPQAAVKRELDRVGEETAAILKGAHSAADDVTVRSRIRADERVAMAEREAERMRSEADAHVRRLDRDTDEVWAERRKLLEDARTMGEALIRLADEALDRFPPAEDGTAPRAGDLAGAASEGPRLEEVPHPDESEARTDTGLTAVTEADAEVGTLGLADAADEDAESGGSESVRKIPRPDAPRHPRGPRR